MNLVNYSDSEGSDSDAGPSASRPAPKAAAKATAKLVNPGTNKIKVNLSSLTSADDKDEAQDARPAKRQRTGGGLNIDAFLPPPKQPAKQLANEGTFATKKVAGKGLGRGVNLKTGAEPAFTRSEATSNLELDSEPRDIKDVIAELRRGRMPQSPSTANEGTDAKEASPSTTQNVKLVGNAMRFKPKSVARGPVKKKTVMPAAPQPIPSAQPAKAVTASTASRGIRPSPAPTPVAKAPTKAKVSLFSMEATDTTSNEPAVDDDVDMADLPDEAFENTPQINPDQAYEAAPAHAAAPSAVDGLNLSASEMRQLFGRKAGKGQMPDMDSIRMVNFNADDQYAANEEFRAKGESVQHNPVRGIAPGKHSLKQLVNAAATQADALEEHFAQGKRNQKEAGSKYGW